VNKKRASVCRMARSIGFLSTVSFLGALEIQV
jgi:hypothetical protein